LRGRRRRRRLRETKERLHFILRPKERRQNGPYAEEQKREDHKVLLSRARKTLLEDRHDGIGRPEPLGEPLFFFGTEKPVRPRNAHEAVFDAVDLGSQRLHGLPCLLKGFEIGSQDPFVCENAWRDFLYTRRNFVPYRSDSGKKEDALFVVQDERLPHLPDLHGTISDPRPLRRGRRRGDGRMIQQKGVRVKSQRSFHYGPFGKGAFGKRLYRLAYPGEERGRQIFRIEPAPGFTFPVDFGFPRVRRSWREIDEEDDGGEEGIFRPPVTFVGNDLEGRKRSQLLDSFTKRGFDRFFSGLHAPSRRAPIARTGNLFGSFEKEHSTVFRSPYQQTGSKLAHS
jgi:hypothetical protein